MQTMTTQSAPSHRTAQEVTEIMQKLRGWEDKYRQLLVWGKQLPVMPDELKSDQILVSGCESRVWLIAEQHDGCWFFTADSDARIIRGLITVIMAAFQGKSSAEILGFDIDTYFEQLNLLAHLSPSRGNGIRAIVHQIQQVTGNNASTD